MMIVAVRSRNQNTTTATPKSKKKENRSKSITSSQLTKEIRRNKDHLMLFLRIISSHLQKEQEVEMSRKVKEIIEQKSLKNREGVVFNQVRRCVDPLYWNTAMDRMKDFMS